MRQTRLLIAACATAALVAGHTIGSAAQAGVSDEANAGSAAAETTADSDFAAVRQIARLGSGMDPTGLVRGPYGSSVFVDRATDRVYEVGKDGYPMVLAESGDLDSLGMSAPLAAVRGGENVTIFDKDGRGWQSLRGLYQLSTRAPNLRPLPGEANGYKRHADAVPIDPRTRAITSFSRGKWEHDVYLAEPTTEDVVRYRPAEGFDHRFERSGGSEVRDLHADPQIWVLTDEGVEHWVDGRRDVGFAIEAPPTGDPDYRFISGVGARGAGELWLYDAAGSRVIAFDKGDGGYQGSWTPGVGEPAMSDARGMYVRGTDGVATSVTWLTTEAVNRGAISDPAAVAGDEVARRGRLTRAERASLAPAIDWASDGIRMQADSVRVKAAGKLFRAPAEVHIEGGSGLRREASLGSFWYDGRVEMRLLIEMGTDGSHWWISDIWTYDGVRGGGGPSWIYYRDLATLTRTPVGEAIEGSLRLKPTSAERKKRLKDSRLQIDGLKLEAFVPGLRWAPLSGCAYLDEPVLAEGADIFEVLQGPAEPLEGIVGLTPTEAEALLQRNGLCYRFNHRYRVTNEVKRFRPKTNRWVERSDLRCSAPEQGRNRVRGPAAREEG